jgi:NADH dehydrogenase FAD-containing subunit
MGVMAYLGNWRAIFQNDVAGDISGRTAFLIWRGAYATKAVSIKNKVSVTEPNETSEKLI